MASFGVSMPDNLHKELDAVAESWYTDRSKAIVRIFQEWKQGEARRQASALPRFMPNPAQAAVKVVEAATEEEEYLGTGPGDDI